MTAKTKDRNARERTGAPAVEADPRPAPSRLKRLRALFSWRRILAVLLAICAIPAVLTLVYRFEPVKPVSTLMLARWVSLQPVDRQWVRIEDVAPVLVNSVLMSEDGQFCSHRGVDWGELKAVVTGAFGGRKPRGASTIPMQTAKNLFLWNDRSFVRKAIELPLAIYLDLVLPKKRTMEIYLNIAEWGDGVFGIEAAAQRHFGRPAARLTARQAALLAVTLPNPIARNPAKPSAGLTRLANVIERRAARAGAYVGCLK